MPQFLNKILDLCIMWSYDFHIVKLPAKQIEVHYNYIIQKLHEHILQFSAG